MKYIHSIECWEEWGATESLSKRPAGGKVAAATLETVRQCVLKLHKATRVCTHSQHKETHLRVFMTAPYAMAPGETVRLSLYCGVRA